MTRKRLAATVAALLLAATLGVPAARTLLRERYAAPYLAGALAARLSPDATVEVGGYLGRRGGGDVFADVRVSRSGEVALAAKRFIYRETDDDIALELSGVTADLARLGTLIPAAGDGDGAAGGLALTVLDARIRLPLAGDRDIERIHIELNGARTTVEARSGDDRLRFAAAGEGGMVRVESAELALAALDRETARALLAPLGLDPSPLYAGSVALPVRFAARGRATRALKPVSFDATLRLGDGDDAPALYAARGENGPLLYAAERVALATPAGNMRVNLSGDLAGGRIRAFLSDSALPELREASFTGLFRLGPALQDTVVTGDLALLPSAAGLPAVAARIVVEDGNISFTGGSPDGMFDVDGNHDLFGGTGRARVQARAGELEGDADLAWRDGAPRGVARLRGNDTPYGRPTMTLSLAGATEAAYRIDGMEGMAPLTGVAAWRDGALHLSGDGLALAVVPEAGRALPRLDGRAALTVRGMTAPLTVTSDDAAVRASLHSPLPQLPLRLAAEFDRMGGALVQATVDADGIGAAERLAGDDARVRFRIRPRPLLERLAALPAYTAHARSLLALARALPEAAHAEGSATLAPPTLHAALDLPGRPEIRFAAGVLAVERFPFHGVLVTVRADLADPDGATLRLETVGDASSPALVALLPAPLTLTARRDGDLLRLRAAEAPGEKAPLELAASLRDGRLLLRDVRFTAAGIELTGSGDLDESGAYRGEFRTGPLARNALALLGIPAHLASVRGASVQVTGEAGALRIRLRAERPVIAGRAYSRLDANLVPDGASGLRLTATLRDGATVVARATAELSGVLPFPELAAGRIELTDLAPGVFRMADGASLSPGRISLRLDVSRGGDGFILAGAGTFRDAFALPQGLPGIESWSGEFGVEDDRFILKRSAGTIRGATARAAGWVAPAADGGFACDLNLVAEGLPYSRLFRSAGRIAPDDPTVACSLFLRGDGGMPALIGKIVVDGGALTDQDLERLRTLRRDTDSEVNLKWRFGPNLRLRSPLFDARSSGKIAFTARGGVDAVSGALALSSGKLHYLGQSFTLEEGEISFATLQTSTAVVAPFCPVAAAPPAALLADAVDFRYQGSRHELLLGASPRRESSSRMLVGFDLKGKTRRQGRQITLRVTGSPERIQTAFSADPEMDPERIQIMLYGMKLTPVAEGGGEAPRAPEFAEFLGGQVRTAIWNKIGESLERGLHLDSVSIKSDQSGERGTLADIEISIGKLVRDDLMITYDKNMVNPAGDALGVEYKVGRRLTVGGRYDRESELRMDARVGLAF